MEEFSKLKWLNRGDFFSSDEVDSLRVYGGFVLKDAFDMKIVDEVHGVLKTVFGLPEKTKRQYLANKSKDPLSAGFSPYGSSRALDTGIPNLLESWDINGVKNYWPCHLDKELRIIEKFQREMHECAITSLNMISHLSGLEILSSDTFQQKKSAGIHLIHYFPLSDDFPSDAVRQSVHADNTIITLIPNAFPSNSPLLVKNNFSGEFTPVEISNSDCIVIFGTALQILSEGRLPSCMHTVMDPRTSSEENVSRYSTPFFLAPDNDFELSTRTGDGQTNIVRFQDVRDRYFKSIFGGSHD